MLIDYIKKLEVRKGFSTVPATKIKMQRKNKETKDYQITSSSCFSWCSPPERGSSSGCSMLLFIVVRKNLLKGKKKTNTSYTQEMIETMKRKGEKENTAIKLKTSLSW